MGLRQVELVGKKYTAERLTKIAALGVVGKFLKGGGEATQEEVIEAFTNPDTIDRMAYWISYIFPQMAADGIVWYGLPSHPKSGIDLDVEDLLSLVGQLVMWAEESFETSASNEPDPESDTESTPETEPAPINPDVAALSAQVEALAKQLEALAPKPTVNVPNPVAALDNQLAQSLLNS